MKYCPKCGAQMDDSLSFCPSCGTPMAAPVAPAAVVPSTDHTAEFDPKDISDNKGVAVLPYRLGFIGVLIASIILNAPSPYVEFHKRQGLKICVTFLLISVVLIVGAIINIIPFLGWIIYGIAALAGFVWIFIAFVLQIIATIQVFKGKAKEPAIISGLNFLK